MTAAYEGAAAKWQAALAEARNDSKVNRAAVLAHPDLAAQLTQPPIGYDKPEQWNGYVPPPTFNGAHNDSHRREALAALVLEAHIRQEVAAA
jgi:hypothetical protein